MNIPIVSHDGEQNVMPPDEFWVRGHDNMQATAADLMALVARRSDYVDICAVGAAAVNTAAKLVVILRERASGLYEFYLTPYKSVVVEDGRTMTRLVFRLTWRRNG